MTLETSTNRKNSWRNPIKLIQWQNLSVILLSSYFTTRTESFSASIKYHRKNNSNNSWFSQCRSTRSRLHIYPPPGSGYIGPDDKVESFESLPDTYEPMMAYPGTMRPGKTPENMPFQDLPIGDDDPDPVPWPHFQQIEWHHRWSEPPHPHPGTMEDFIAAAGRWATPEQEAAMRAGVRRGVRQSQELAEAEKRETIITDDDDDEDEVIDYSEKEEPIALGDGVFGRLGSDADRAATAAAVTPGAKKKEEEPDDMFVDDGLDDFLLDLGLDSDFGGAGDTGSSSKKSQVATAATDDDDDDDDDEDTIRSDGKGGTAAINVDDDDDDLSSLGLDDDDDDGLGTDGVSTVPLEDFGDNDSLDADDIFDDGGFDYDDNDYGGGDDVW